jgi:hypothetical protein
MSATVSGVAYKCPVNVPAAASAGDRARRRSVTSSDGGTRDGPRSAADEDRPDRGQGPDRAWSVVSATMEGARVPGRGGSHHRYERAAA